MNFINIFYGNEDVEIEESYVKYDTNFEKKSINFNYKTIDINDKEAKPYIESNSYTKKYLNYLSKNTGEILVDTDNNKLIGYVFVGKSKDKGFISTLEIVKEYRGYGFGKELLKDAINKYNAIDLVVYKDNKVALDMYKKFGFVIIGEDKNGKAWYMKLRSKISKDDKIEEACKDLKTARKFVTDVQKMSKKYDANFFMVTDGASGYSNGNGGSNPAVKNARNKQIEWEKEHGFDPNEDWSKKESYTLEAGKDITSKIILERLYPRVKDVLSTPQGDRKFKIMVGSYMDRNQDKLYEIGPNHLIPFTDQQKNEYFDLFNVDKKEIMEMTKEILKQLGSSSDFKYLNNNPIFFLFYCCIRYYYITKNDKGLNTALAIYALSVYPSVWSVYFKYPPNPGVMQYTVDHLTEKYILKQAGNIFNALFTSINRTFTTYSTKDTERGFISIVEASDKEVIRFIQRIHNDQKSMIRNIVDMYMINHRKGLRISDNLESQDSITIDPDKENNSSVVDSVTNKVLIPIISNGVNLKIVTQSKDLAQISLVECRYYISKILIDKYTDDIRRMIQAILFRFLYDDKNRREDINSSKYLVWCSQLFRQTNSKNENVKIIKDTLDKWSEETGIHAKYKREATRVNYKKAIFFYFCISIQYYNQ